MASEPVAEPLSEHCSLMAKPGGPAKPAQRPADCPKDAAYIKTVDEGGDFKIPGYAPFPVVFEGGKGDDHVTLIGSGGKVLVRGGEGNDSLLVKESAPLWQQPFALQGDAIIVIAGLVCGSILSGMLIWRSSSRKPAERDD
jgi:hypothetical protein